MTSPKTVLVTGSSSGIGRATVEYFSQQGWQVAATLRRPADETALAQLPGVRLFALDVNNATQVTQTIAEVVDQFSGLDVLINNAGYTTLGVFEAASEEQIRQQFETNLFGLMRTTRAVLPHFRARRAGLIINVSSLGGRMTFPLYSLYHGTKWAVEGFSESLSYELEPLNIGVKLIEPGSVKTDFNGRSTVPLPLSAGLGDYAAYEQRVLAKYDALLQAGQGAEPVAIAQAIFAAATDGSNQLRYPCPPEAAGPLLQMRHDMPLEQFRETIKQMFG